MQERLGHGLEEVGLFREGELGLWGWRGGGFSDGDPAPFPAADGEAFEDVVVVGGAGLTAGLAGGAVLMGGCLLVEGRGVGKKGGLTKEMRAGMVARWGGRVLVWLWV